MGIGQPRTGMPNQPPDWFSRVGEIPEFEPKPRKPTYSEKLKEFFAKVRHAHLEHVSGK